MTDRAKYLDIMGGTSHFSGGLCLQIPMGAKGSLTSVVHQANFEVKAVSYPAGVEFWGMDGGPLLHSSEAIYRQARTATFMGRKIISSFAADALKNEAGESHLANLSADIWRAIRELVPESLNGQQFIAAYGPLEPGEGAIAPEHSYRVGLATEHPIYENERSNKFVRFLELADSNPNARHHFLTAAGELMVQSHFSYDHRCKLGNVPSDLLVKLAREAGKDAGIYGAKLSGDGDSTAIALLCDRQKNPALENTINSLAAAFETATGIRPQIFHGN